MQKSHIQLLLVVIVIFVIASASGRFTILQVTTATKVYETSFETASVSQSRWNLDGLDPDSVNGEEMSSYLGQTDWEYGVQFIEGLDRVTPGFTPHTGGRCLGLEVEKPESMWTRSSFALYPVGGGGDHPSMTRLVQDEFYVSLWYYFPSNWSLESPTNKWYSLFSVGTIPTYQPYHVMHIHASSPSARDVPVDGLRATIDCRWDGANYYEVARYDGFEDVLPLGRWFEFEWYMYRHTEDGIIKVWVDGNLIFNITGIPIWDPNRSPNNLFDFVMQEYYENDDLSYHIRWVDDIEIWNGLPGTAPNGNGNGNVNGNGNQTTPPTNGLPTATDVENVISEVPVGYIFVGTALVGTTIVVIIARKKKWV